MSKASERVNQPRRVVVPLNQKSRMASASGGLGVVVEIDGFVLIARKGERRCDGVKVRVRFAVADKRAGKDKQVDGSRYSSIEEVG